MEGRSARGCPPPGMTSIHVRATAVGGVRDIAGPGPASGLLSGTI
ncbi:MAG: hypothetical protein Q7U64_09050 [Desulfocapsaceae bacterium]|nr:hypothetical protein [Desulfocapsaceae bacterium]